MQKNWILQKTTTKKQKNEGKQIFEVCLKLLGGDMDQRNLYGRDGQFYLSF